MTLSNIMLLCIITALALQFWRLRGISEAIIVFAKRYCEREGLQFISLARVNTRPGLHKGKLDWRITYDLEFSSDGENAYIGKIETIGKRIISVNLPVFRVVSQG